MRVVTVGSFDPLHAGHLGLFKQCRRLAGPDGKVIVGVNGDEFIQGYKGKPPLVPLASRIAVIDNLKMVDGTFPNHLPHGQLQAICEQSPDILVVGEDWARNNYLTQLKGTQKWLDTNNIQLCYVPRTGDWSSSALKKNAQPS